MTGATPVVPVLLCGGSGTRLWPLSREGRPKQFLALLEPGTSLLQQTLRRAFALSEEPPLIVCNTEHRFQVAEQLAATLSAAQVEGARIILEPVARNTAPAIALAAHAALERHPEGAYMLVLPSDHVIRDEHALQAAMHKALDAVGDTPVTFGIVPHRPETGFGYLEVEHAGADDKGPMRVQRFIEKPPLDAARHYLQSGRHFWNSGMFLLDAAAYLTALDRLAANVAAPARQAWRQRREDPDFVRADAASLRACSSISIDYAVMEKLDELTMIPLDAGWDDLGSFHALWELRDKDTNGNAQSGKTVCVDTHNSLILASDRVVTTLGLRDLVVIDTPDALLVASREAAQNIRELVIAVGNSRPDLL